jgi:hypothetical protein
MTATITKEIREFFITDTIGYNLVAFLINMPSLGNTDTPTNDQLLNRENLTMASAAAQEVTATSYARYIASIDPTDIVEDNDGKFFISVTAVFTPTSDNPIGPVTHVVWARGANLVGATELNGNNRGDTTGIVYKVEPLVAAPQTLIYPVVFKPTITIEIAI